MAKRKTGKTKAKAKLQGQSLVFKRREDVLSTALAAVCGDRHLNYGGAEDNFTRIADLYNSWLRIRKPGNFAQATVENKLVPTLTTQDVTVFNILQKLARLANTPNHFDSWADIAGYAACGAECCQADKPE